MNETKPPQSNRRRSRRAPTRSNVKMQCRKGALGLGPNLTLRVLDVSDTGVRLVVSQGIDPPSDVEIIIEGYGLRGNIKRMGTVRWQVKLDSGEFCIGIEFQKPLPHRDWHSIVAPT